MIELSWRETDEQICNDDSILLAYETDEDIKEIINGTINMRRPLTSTLDASENVSTRSVGKNGIFSKRPFFTTADIQERIRTRDQNLW